MKTIVFDFDSTLVKVEALDLLAERSLRDLPERERIVGEIRKITEMGMLGEIGFPESLARRIALISTNRKAVDETAQEIAENITASVLRNLEFFKSNSDSIYIISGGFKEMILLTARILGIPDSHVLANDFIFDDRGGLIGVNQDNFMAQEKGKVKQLKALDLPGELIMVGDGWTDYETREAGIATKFVAYTENVSREKVVEKADFVVKDFEEFIEYYNKISNKY